MTPATPLMSSAIAAPAAIPRGLAGRAVMRLGPDEMLTFQTARCTTPLLGGGTELDVLVDAVRDACVLVGARSPASPWLAPLPQRLPVDESSVAQGIIGLVDDPDRQRVEPLRWDRADGNLLLVGAAGSGVTSTLVLLGTVAIADGSGSHLYVIDGRGDQALTIFETSPWCGGVVRLHERERVIRLINRVADELTRRIADPAAPRHPIVVLIDGLDAARGSLDDLEGAAESDKLEAILTLGPAHDVMMVCAIDRVAAVPSSVLARFAQRWVFHLTDPLDAVGLGVASADVPGSIPGRIFVTSTGLEAQLMVGQLPLSSRADGAVPATVECFPAVLHASDDTACRAVRRRLVAADRVAVRRRSHLQSRRPRRRTRVDHRAAAIGTKYSPAANRPGLGRGEPGRLVARRCAAPHTARRAASTSLTRRDLRRHTTRRPSVDCCRRRRTRRRHRWRTCRVVRIAPTGIDDRRHWQTRLASPELRPLDRCRPSQQARPRHGRIERSGR